MSKGAKVVFLDRDGTMNVEVNYLHRPEDLQIIPGTPEALRRLREAGYLLVVVSNQAGVARGYYTEDEVKRFHRYFEERLEAAGAAIDRWYYCPHHPEHGIGIYRTACRCRKPGTGMLEQAERELGPIDRSASWMIGDARSDIGAGAAFGVRTILVGTGYGEQVFREDQAAGRRPAYDFFAADLARAADLILRKRAGRRAEGQA